MNGITMMIIAIVVLGGAYLLYGRYLQNKWGIDPKAKTITLDLNQLTKKQDVLVKGTKLDLVNDEFKFNVKVPLK